MKKIEKKTHKNLKTFRSAYYYGMDLITNKELIKYNNKIKID